MIQMKKSKIQKVWMKTNVNEMRWNQTKWSETAVLISERMVQHIGPWSPDWIVKTLLEKKVRNKKWSIWGMTSGKISLTVPKLKIMKEGLMYPHWRVTTSSCPPCYSG